MAQRHRKPDVIVALRVDMDPLSLLRRSSVVCRSRDDDVIASRDARDEDVHGVSAKLDVVWAFQDVGSVVPTRLDAALWHFRWLTDADEAGHVMPEAATPIEVSDVCDLDADRGPSSAVVESFTAARCARADGR